MIRSISLRCLTAAAIALVAGASPRASAAASGLAQGAPADTFEMVTIAKGLSQPTDLAVAPDGRLIVVERLGSVIVLGADGKPTRDTPAHVSVTPVATDPKYGTEQGLLGLVLDPDFATNHTLYFYASMGSDPERKNQILKTVLADDGTLGELTPLLKAEDPALRGPWNHNGGGLAIYERQLYIGVGDTGHNKSPPNNRLSTCLNSPNGKILRINLDGSIPRDNPLAQLTSVTGCTDWDQPLSSQPPDKRIFAWGVRNPFRFWIDPQNGNLWLGDVGENTREEVSIVKKGQHMGWPFVEGTKHFAAKFQDFQPANACQGITPASECAAPLYDYGHANNRKCIIGGLIPTQACEWPEAWRDKYFFGDQTSGEVFTLDVNAERTGLRAGAPAEAQPFATVAGMSAIRMGHDNALYIVEVTSGSIQRVTVKTKDKDVCQPAAGGASSGGAGTGPEGGSANVAGNAGAAIGGGGSPNGGMPASGGVAGLTSSGAAAGNAANAATPSSGDAGCACRASSAGRAKSFALSLAGALVLALAAARRRRQRGPRP